MSNILHSILHNGIETELQNKTSEELKAYYEKDPIGYYQQYVKGSVSPYYNLERAAIGVSEEAGEICGVILKMARYTDATTLQKKWGMTAKEKLKSELGDLLFQVFNVANQAELDIKDVMDYNLYKLDNRHSSDGTYEFGAGYANTRADGGTFERK